MEPFSWRGVIKKLQKNPQGLWDYITALRGPDNMGNEGYFLKNIFTLLLRGEEDGFCGLGIADLEWFLWRYKDEEIMKEIGDIEKLKGFVGHWFNHVRYALKSLHELGIIEYELVKIVNDMWLKDWKDGLKELLRYYRKKLFKEEK